MTDLSTRKLSLSEAKVWFTADTHFGHGNIIALCNRPFTSVDEMNAALIANWNDRVNADDYIFHLGDFAFLPAGPAGTILEKLKGRKILMAGNHDSSKVRRLAGFEEVCDYRELSLTGEAGKTSLVLSHYPIEYPHWHHARRGVLHLHGHCHGTAAPAVNRLDVGVDVCGFAPVQLPEIKQRMAQTVAASSGSA